MRWVGYRGLHGPACAPQHIRSRRGRQPETMFWQVTADLPFAVGVPAGHGHVYTREYVDGWAQVLQPRGWTEDRAARLREIIGPGA